MPWVPDGFRGALCTETREGLCDLADVCLGAGIAHGRPAVQAELLQSGVRLRKGEKFFSIRPAIIKVDGELKFVE